MPPTRATRIGTGFIMLGIVMLRLLLWRRGTLFDIRWFLRLCPWVAPLGFVVVLAGWTTTEVGRQPWRVYGQLRTAHFVSPSLTGRDVLPSLLAYMAAGSLRRTSTTASFRRSGGSVQGGS